MCVNAGNAYILLSLVYGSVPPPNEKTTLATCLRRIERAQQKNPFKLASALFASLVSLCVRISCLLRLHDFASLLLLLPFLGIELNILCVTLVCVPVHVCVCGGRVDL